MSVLHLILVVVECRKIVRRNRSVTAASCDAWLTVALSSSLVTVLVLGPADITVTALATERVVVLDVECSINAFITTATVDQRSALALTTVHVARLAPAHCPTNTAATVFAAIWILYPEVPVSRLARVTYPAANSILALTQLAVTVRSTASDWVAWNLLRTGRITAALLTAGVVVVVGPTFVAGKSVKGW